MDCPHFTPAHLARWAPVMCETCRAWVDADGSTMNAATCRERHPALIAMVADTAARWAPVKQPAGYASGLIAKTAANFVIVCVAIPVIVVLGAVAWMFLTAATS